jgi:uncharacterized protein YndB with AHSA1/START domain
MMINKNAPVAAAGEIEIAADPEAVWDIMAAIDRWPSWNPDVKWASLDGGLAEGRRFRWRSGPGTITSTIRSVERPWLLAWTGKTFGVNAIHVWRLESRDGSTIVRTEESWEGLVARIFRGPMRKTLETAINAGLRYLKAEAERRSAR